MQHEETWHAFVRAALEEISPGEHLLLRAELAVPPARAREESGESTALGFGPADAAQWVAPCLIATAAWLWSAAQAPLKERLTQYMKEKLAKPNASKVPPDNSLIQLADQFKEACLTSGFGEAESERLRGALLSCCLKNPNVVRALVL